MKRLTQFIAALATVAMVACGGGGGSAGTATGGGGGGGSGGGSGGGGTNPGTPTLEIELSSDTVTAANPVDVTFILKDAAKAPLAGKVVTIATIRGYATLSAPSVLTDKDGRATAKLTISGVVDNGADEITASAVIETTSVSATPKGYQVKSSAPTVSVELAPGTVSASAKAQFTATVRDSQGNPSANQIVRFSTSDPANVGLSAASRATDAAGKASVTVSTLNPSVNAAAKVVATATLGGKDVSSEAVVSLVGEVPSLVIDVSSTTVSQASPVTVSATLKSASGAPVVGAIVSFSTAAGLGRFSANSALTDASGVAQVTLAPVGATTVGADLVSASASVNGVQAQMQRVVQFVSAPATNSPTISLSLTPANVTASSPAVAVATVLDALGQPVSGLVVSFKTTFGLGKLSVATALTNSSGQATVSLSGASTASNGADELVASATVGASSISASKGFTVQPSLGDIPTITITTSSSTASQAAPVVATATVKNSLGAAIEGAVVTFSGSLGRASFDPTTAVTNAAGVAVSVVSPVTATTSGADFIGAQVTVKGTTASTQTVLQFLPNTSGGLPTLGLALSSTALTTATPIQAFATVRDAKGATVAGQVVAFQSRLTLAKLSVATALTNASGVASVTLTPATVSTVGADDLIATTSLGGSNAQDSKGFTVSTTSADLPSLRLTAASPTASRTAPALLTATVTDKSGAPLADRIVSFSSALGLGAFDRVTAVTNASGVATANVSPLNSSTNGADFIQAQVSVNGVTASDQVVMQFVPTAGTGSPSLELDLSTLTVRTDTPATVTATVRSAAGAVLSGQVVSFKSLGGLGVLSAPAALTDVNGRAIVTLVPVAADTKGADQVQATATVAGTAVQDTKGFLAEPSPANVLRLNLVVAPKTASRTAPATATATLTTGAGTPVADAIVTFSSVYGLASFNAITVKTNASGVATAVVSPLNANTAGAEVIEARATANSMNAVGRDIVTFEAQDNVSGTVDLTLTDKNGIATTTVSSTNPGTVTATVRDSKNQPLAGLVVSFKTVRNLGSLNVQTALTDATGKATALLYPTNPGGTGADEVSASVTLGGADIQRTKGFQTQATNVALADISPATATVCSYCQTSFTIGLSDYSTGVPVNVALTSACVAAGKASLSPATLTITQAAVNVLYVDKGCGPTADTLQASVLGSSAAAKTAAITVQSPTVGSIAFVGASPATIYLKSSGLTETSIVTFQVNDQAGNPLTNQDVTLSLLTLTGGIKLDDGTVAVTKKTNSLGQVSARINSGSVPTPVRIKAVAASGAETVSSGLSVAVGLPSQLNFSLAQGTINIEGYQYDGVPNGYTIIAADRNGNPVPSTTDPVGKPSDGTSINFVAEGGQIEAVKKTVYSASGIATVTANFVSASPRPLDGRVTVVAYALGEESFIDLNGNNQWDAGEPFQDLGAIYKDRVFDGIFDANLDEFIDSGITGTGACAAPPASPPGVFTLNAQIPSKPNTCDNTWGKNYVRRATETVLSMSTADPVWDNDSNSFSSALTRWVNPAGGGTVSIPDSPSSSGTFRLVRSSTVNNAGTSGNLALYIRDANPYRFNPMAATSSISVKATDSVAVAVLGGSPVPSTSEPSVAVISYDFKDAPVGTTQCTVTVQVTSARGVVTSVSFTLIK